MFCCSNCFSDNVLKNKIGNEQDSNGTCSFCNSENVNLIIPSKLKDDFEQLKAIYKEDNGGKPLVEWFKEDWGLFIHEKMDNANANMLLIEIYNDAEIIRKYFKPLKKCSSDSINLWNDFKDELKKVHRFLPDKTLQRDLLSKLFIELKINPDNETSIWYRARINRQEKVFELSDMGAPPRDKATAGRANPQGIPYLYLASNEDTAISEIRPHTGDLICVAEVAIENSLDIIDLRNPRSTISPFDILGDDKNIASLRCDIEFLIHLGEELKRPILPHSAAIDYLPTQYICELMKKDKYHGVLYNSSVGDGVNLALFDPELGEIANLKHSKVSQVLIKCD